jgi:hypothetical protein
MWGPPYRQGYWGDSRVEASAEILGLWQREIRQDRWLLGGVGLSEALGFQPIGVVKPVGAAEGHV